MPTGAHVLRDCADRLRMGFDVLVFPEGTRSPVGGQLYPFHRGAFELAARAKVPIVLLKLTCVPAVLSKGLPIWKVSDHIATLTIEPIDVIYPADGGIESRTLCREIEQRYRDLFGYPALAVPASEPQPLGDLQ
ncbi:MAG TPA: lysophospholipid acyltransferase family protein [Kofleriaceae bacterium]|nr:lysophospholipid acyltransferase family protein [Kofleriaceae bacterium]